jgi:hypothetical protein
MFRVSRTITQYSIDVVREGSERRVNHGEKHFEHYQNAFF